MVPLLTTQSYSVSTPDLPGHGNNALPLDKITLKSYVSCIKDLLTQISGEVILVGHSMAGMVISEVAAQAPERIRQLVYVSAYLPRHGESLFDLITLNRSHEPFTAIELAMQMSDDKCAMATSTAMAGSADQAASTGMGMSDSSP